MGPHRTLTVATEDPARGHRRPVNPVEKRLVAYHDGDVYSPALLRNWRADWRQRTAPSKGDVEPLVDGPYLKYIKNLVTRWPHLQLLADFMEVGTAPVRWYHEYDQGGYRENRDDKEKERKLRCQKTSVSLIDYHKDSTNPKPRPLKSPEELTKEIEKIGDNDDSVKFRLWVVEDLSREVIEILGSHYDIDPSFFREHLVDYVWHNIRDWWRDPPNLDIASRGQNWFQMRFPRLRYFLDKHAFEKGKKQVSEFNVERRLESDYNQSKFWDTIREKGNGLHEQDNVKREENISEEHGAYDKIWSKMPSWMHQGHDPEEAKVGTLRTRVTFWMREPRKKSEKSTCATKTEASSQSDTVTSTSPPAEEAVPQGPVVGILLLDPTVKEGHPLWRDLQYRNWSKVPSMGEGLDDPIGPPLKTRSTFYEEFLYWATTPEAFNFWNCVESDDNGHGEPSDSPPSPICLPTQALLHMVCNEWLTLLEYIKTRLMQIDWAIAFPENFLTKDEQIEQALHKLHHWRRVIPVYRTMLAETFLRVFRETKHPDKMHPDKIRPGLDECNDSVTLSNFPMDNGGHTSEGMMSAGRHRHSAHIIHGGRAGRPFIRHVGVLNDLMNRDCINSYKQDYSIVLAQMEECQSRIDRLTEVLTAVISMQDSRRGYKDNKNLQWLTWLATFFIPLSFVATMLSMTTGPVSELRGATILWAEVSIPSGLLIILFVGAMSIARSRRWLRNKLIKIPWVGQQLKKQKGP